jgi:ribosomal protein S18 acetylase RimI-like enzyme
MEIRLIRDSEFTVLGEITVRAYRHLSDEESLGDYESELRDVAARALDSEVFVAVVDGAVIGGVTYVPDHSRAMSEFSDPEAAGIRMLAVDPLHQGLGAGRSLVDTCIARARDQGRRRILLHSTPQMEVARAMYLRLGFELLPEIDVFYDGPPFTPEEPLHLIGYVLELS